MSQVRARWLAAVPVVAVLVTAVGAGALEAAAPNATVMAPVRTQDAAGFIDHLGERALAAVTAGGDPAQRVSSAAALLEQAADLDLIARLVLGRHWQQASEAQWQEYLRLLHRGSMHPFRSHVSRDRSCRRLDTADVTLVADFSSAAIKR